MSRKSRYALGILEEGQHIYVASLVKEDGVVKIINADVFNIDEINESSNTHTEAAGDSDFAEALLEKEAESQQGASSNKSGEMAIKDDDVQLTLGGDGEEGLSFDDEMMSSLQHDVVSGSKKDAQDHFALPGLKDDSFKKYADLFYRIYQRSPRSAELAISMHEPKIYYTNFYTDWGLQGAKLKQKIIQELSTEQQDYGVRIPDQVDFLPSAGTDIVTVASDVVSDFRSVAREYQQKYGKHLPQIRFIESEVCSLVNLVNLNYEINEEEISVIIYVGAENTRLVFMQGNQLLHISPIINEGTDSILIFEIIYNKIILEQDNLNITKIDRIFTAGAAGEMGVKTYLASMFPGDVQKTVEDIELTNLFVYDKEKFSVERLAQFAIPIAAAWRCLERKNERLIHIDLLPSKLRESQKILKLGVGGWVTMSAIFGLSLFFTVEVADFKKQIIEKNNELQVKRIELDHLQALDQELTKANQRLDFFKKTYSVLDSMLSQTKDYHSFFSAVSNDARRIGGIWVSEVTHEGPSSVSVRGFALNRNKIANYSESIGKTTLKMVEAGDIRERTVYRFQLSANIPYKDRLANQQNVALKKASPLPDKKQSIAAKPVQTGNPSGATIQSEREFQARYEQARTLFNRYQYQAAIKEFKALIASGFNSSLMVNCYYWLGECYFGLKKYDEAIENFKYVLTRESLKKSAATFMTGRAYAAKGDYTTSNQYMDLVINQYPHEPLAKKATNFKRKQR